MSFYISGTGSSLPKRVVTNAELTGFLDTSDEWITSRTGISERRVLSDESLLDLAAEASRLALKDAGKDPGDVGMIICSSLIGDYISPALGVLIRDEIGAVNAKVLDINEACSGFIYALDVAAAYIDSGRTKNVLVVCAEALSRLVDWRDRSSCILFGDGAGAVMLEKGDALLALHVTGKANSAILNVPRIPGNSPFTEVTVHEPGLLMDGQEVFMFAVAAIIDEINAVLGECSLTPDDITFYVLHQANIRIINTARKKFGQSADKFPHNIERCGNTSSASIPILLDSLNKSGKLREGMKLIFCAFGAGLTTGTCVIEWRKPSTCN